MQLPEANNQPNDFPADGAARSRRPQGDFQSLFEVAAKRLGMGREFRAIKVCHTARGVLEKMLPEFTGQYRIGSFQEGVLNISTGNPALGQKIQMFAHQLLAEVNAREGANTVKKVRTKTGQTPPTFS